jgi:hypothetical protein
MKDRHKPNADRVPLIAGSTEGAEQQERVAGQAFCRLTALTGMLARLKELARSRDPEAVEALPPDAGSASCDDDTLFRYFDSRPWDSVRVAANGTSRARQPVTLHSGMADGG